MLTPSFSDSQQIARDAGSSPTGGVLVGSPPAALWYGRSLHGAHNNRILISQHMADHVRPPHIVAVYLLLFRGSSTLLARRQNTGFEDGKYSLISGHVEAGETAHAAMVREAREEAVVTVLPEDLVLTHCMHRRSKDARIDLFFTVERWGGEPIIGEPEKCDDLRWFPLDELPEDTIPYIRTVIAHHRAGIRYSSVGW